MAQPASSQTFPLTPSITLSSDGEKRINVALEAGAAGDDHALYLAFANADMGADLASWAAFQRVGRVPAYATAAPLVAYGGPADCTPANGETFVAVSRAVDITIPRGTVLTIR